MNVINNVVFYNNYSMKAFMRDPDILLLFNWITTRNTTPEKISALRGGKMKRRFSKEEIIERLKIDATDPPDLLVEKAQKILYLVDHKKEKADTSKQMAPLIKNGFIEKFRLNDGREIIYKFDDKNLEKVDHVFYAYMFPKSIKKDYLEILKKFEKKGKIKFEEIPLEDLKKLIDKPEVSKICLKKFFKEVNFFPWKTDFKGLMGLIDSYEFCLYGNRKWFARSIPENLKKQFKEFIRHLEMKQGIISNFDEKERAKISRLIKNDSIRIS